MKTIKYLLMLIAVLLMAGCVEDKMYEGPSTIKSIAINPEAPTSFDDVTVTAKVEGLQVLKKVTLEYTTGAGAQTVEMSGSNGTYTGVIPAQPDGTKVSYKVTVLNEAGYTTVVEKDYTVGDKPSDYSKLVINELYGAAAEDAGKFIELYNNGDAPVKLKGVTLNKDEELTWTGIEGEIVMPHSCFAIIGAKGTTARGFSSGFSAKKSVLVELFDPNGKKLDVFQRGEKGAAWGATSLTSVKGSWSRCPDGTGKFMITDPTCGEKNRSTGTVDNTVVQ